MSFKIFIFTILFLLSLSFVNSEGNSELQAFAQWLANNKVLSRTNLGVFEGQRFGGIAGTDIKTGDALLRVPISLAITKEVIGKEAWAHSYKEWVFDKEPLMVWLASNLGNEESFWAPYLNILPKEFPTFPIYWTEEEVNELQGSSVKVGIASTKYLLSEAYKKLKNGLVDREPALASVTFERYVWAYCIVTSRLWTFGNDYALVPLGDLLNYRPDTGLPGIDASKQYFEVNATQDYSKGDQVFVSYGNKSNSELLLNYGFILEDNPHEAALINFQFRATNLAILTLEPILKKADPSYQTIRLYENHRPDALLRAFRIANMEYEDLKYANQLLEGKPINVRNELLAYRAAIGSLSSLFKSYTTTIEDDNKLLESGSLSTNVRNAVLIRRNEKKIIQNMVLVLAKLWENILVEGTLPTGVAI